MFFDAYKIANEMPEQMDVCIVGAGVAGLVVARRLARTGLNVWLLESGGQKANPDAQALNQGQSNLADYPFMTSRARVFGGTSSLWNGACVPLDPEDFEHRNWIKNSGWPIKAQDIDAYLNEAREDFGIASTDAFQANLNRTPFGQGDLSAKAVAYSAPLNLGARYHDFVARSKTVHCLLNATVTELFPSSSGTQIDSLQFSTPGKPARSITPRMVVLASGGIENARLLLSSNSVLPEGVGNAHDVVGRYHMEHPIRTVGVLPVGNRGPELVDFTNTSQVGGVEVQGTFGLSNAVRRREHLMDLHIRCYRYSRFEDEAPVIAGKRAALGRKSSDTKGGSKDWLAALRPVSLRYLTWHTKNKLWRNARYDHLRFMAFLEQEPEAENRILLSNERDAFGCQLPNLIFRESNYMRDSATRSMDLMANALATAGLSGLRHGDEALSHLQDYDDYGLHQMGSTRMASDPRLGVVDRECRVHGVSNLFVCGSSVFPTGGAANPTWTIAALSLRTADALRDKICYS